MREASVPVVDLTADDDDNEERNGTKAAAAMVNKRPAAHGTVGPSSSARQRVRDAVPDVWLVIHDGEPQRTGSDFQYDSYLPQRIDTNIVSVHSTYEGAKRRAADYVLGNITRNDQCDWEEDDFEDDEYVLGFDWGRGVYRPEFEDRNTNDDRVHIMKKTLRP